MHNFLVSEVEKRVLFLDTCQPFDQKKGVTEPKKSQKVPSLGVSLS